MIGASIYKPTKVLAALLSSHVGQTHSYVKNSTHLVDILKNVEVEDSDILVSFDVESLFTRISVTDSNKLVEEKNG